MLFLGDGKSVGSKYFRMMKNLFFTLTVMIAACFYLLAGACIATAQEPGGLISGITHTEGVVPGKAITSDYPDDPHMQGSWLVSVDRFGYETWYELQLNDGGDYITNLGFLVVLCGSRAHFYFCFNGQKYVAPAKDTPLVLGYTMKNKLEPYNPTSDELYYYTTDAGFYYVLGLSIMYDEVTMEFRGLCIISIQGNPVGEPAKKGDVNLDFSVGISDVTSLVDYLLNNSYWIDMGNADVDNDGKVGISDVTSLIDLLLNS